MQGEMKSILEYIAFIGIAIVAGAVMFCILLVRGVVWCFGGRFYYERKAG